MKIQKEVWLVIAAVAFLLSWLIDRLAGPVSIFVGNPIAFLRSTLLLHRYPFTATSILVRTLGLFISSMLIISLFEGRYFTKVIVLLFIGTLAEFFAIQQLATGFRVTTIQWTLAIAYASLTLTVGIVWLTLKGIWSMMGGKEVPQEYKDGEESVLKPPPDTV